MADSPHSRSRLERFLYRGCTDLNDHAQRRSAAMSAIFSHLGTLFCLVFGTMALINGTHSVLVATFSAAAIMMLMHYPMMRVLGLIRVQLISVAGVAALLIYFMASGGTAHTGHIWIFVFPPMTFFALGLRRGGLLVGLTIVAVAIILFWLYSGLDPETFTTAYKARYLGALIFVAIVSAVSEQSRQAGYRQFSREIQAHRETEAELRRAKAIAEDASRAKSDFLANMSHELRTPLNGVIGMTSLLRNSDLGEQEKQYTEVIDISANTLLHLINDILDLSKIEAGRLELEPQEFSPLELVQGTILPHRNQAEQKGVSLTLTVQDVPPPRLQGDPIRIRQILDNLIGNAVKFTEAGTIEVSLSWQAAGPEQVVLRAEVADSGIGIAVDQLRAIFDKFTQADGSATRQHGGTGLGLAISKQLVELMSGEIGVDSTLGQGSRFWFSLPLPRA